MSDIIDFHTHAYPPKVAVKAVQFLNDYYHVQCQGDGTIENLLASARAGGVGTVVVHAVATKPSQVEDVNNWIAAHTSDRVIGFGTIHPGYAHIPTELRRIRTLGLRGLKIHPDFQHYFADDPSMDVVYENVAGELPVLIHAGDKTTDFSSPWRIANVVSRYPKLTVIAAHLGGYSEWDEAEEHLIGKRLYIDTSSSLWALPAERAVRIIRRHGVERVLFGTDYPLTYHKEEMRRFMALPLTEAERRLILHDNAARLLGLGPAE